MIIFAGCAKLNVFEKTIHIKNQSWTYDIKPAYNFNITDTASPYIIYIVLRHTDSYRYNNIWLSVGSQAPGDTMVYQNLNLQLANDAKGWEGFGIDDIYEVRKNITPGPVFLRKQGNYHFIISQIMRESPLEHILDVGIRVEKISK